MRSFRLSSSLAGRNEAWPPPCLGVVGCWVIVGGGVSRKADEFLLLHLRAAIVAAQLQNSAGIIGEALDGR